ncbi:MAG: Gfo/Idh/MocA family oxidoreductase, partial [Candidatus Bathyarchaeia archaeon]
LAEIIPEVLKSVASEYGIDNAFTDYHDLLDMAEVEAVSICTPTAFHAQPTIDAAKAGKHVLCEKPMAMNYKEAKKMVAACDKTGVKLGICSARARTGSYPINGDIDLARSYMQRLGKIYYTSMSGPSRFRGRPGLDILKDSKWFLDSSKAGGGVLADLGCYSLDLLLYLMNNPQPVAVSALTFKGVGKEMKIKETYDVEEHASLFIRFNEGFATTFDIANAFNIWRDDLWRDNLLTLTILGTEGGLKLEGDLASGRVTFCTEQEEIAEPSDATARERRGRRAISVDLPPSKRNIHEDFVAACLENRLPATPGKEGLKIMQITSMAYMSAKLGREVTLRDLES